MEVPRGTLVCKSQPFAYALYNLSRGHRCDYCLQKKNNLRRCSQCEYSYYCDKICQKSAWKKDHKHECNNIKRVFPWQPSSSMLLISRVIYKLKHHTDRGEKIGNVIRYFKDLESHNEDIKKDAKRVPKDIFFRTKLTELLPSEILPSFPELMEIIGKIEINSFGITDEETQTIGIGLYLGASIFDHSCRPNAMEVFEGPTMFVYATEHIQSLDYSKIYLTYTNLLATCEERREKLQSTYYFHCNCERCQNVDEDDELRSIKCVSRNCGNPVRIKDGSAVCTSCGIVSVSKKIIEGSTAAMDMCMKSFKEIEELKELKLTIIARRTESVLKSADLFLHPKNIHYVRIADLALEANLELKNVSRVAELAKVVLPAYRKCCGPYNPIFGMLLLSIGKLELFSNRLDDAKEKLIEAARIIDATHGQNHPLRATCFALLAKLSLSQ